MNQKALNQIQLLSSWIFLWCISPILRSLLIKNICTSTTIIDNFFYYPMHERIGLDTVPELFEFIVILVRLLLLLLLCCCVFAVQLWVLGEMIAIVLERVTAPSLNKTLPVHIVVLIAMFLRWKPYCSRAMLDMCVVSSTYSILF